MKYIKYFNEAISGTEIPEMTKGSYFGPGYGDTKSPNTINQNDTKIIFSELDSKFWSLDDYNNIYQEYLKMGGKPLDGFNSKNLDTIISFINP
jgi:hypothetical protein